MLTTSNSWSFDTLTQSNGFYINGCDDYVYFEIPGTNWYWVNETKKEDSPMYVKYDLLGERVYKFALPGVKKEDIKVYSNNVGFYVEAEWNIKNDNMKNVKSTGFALDGKVKQYFELPDGYNLANIESEYADGVLTVKVPFENDKVFKPVKVK